MVNRMPRWLITLLAFAAGCASWLVLAFVVTRDYVPTADNVLDWTVVSVALFLVFVGVTGVVLAPIHYLNYRFGAVPAVEGEGSSDRLRMYRQSLLLGILAVMCLWFQLMRVLNWIIVALLVGVLVLIEVFFRSRSE